MVRPWVSVTPAPTPQTRQISAKTQSGPGTAIAPSTTAPPAIASSTARPGRRRAPSRIWSMVDAIVPPQKHVLTSASSPEPPP